MAWPMWPRPPLEKPMIDFDAFEARLYRNCYGTPAPWEPEFAVWEYRYALAHNGDLVPWEVPARPVYADDEDLLPEPEPTPAPTPAPTPVAEPEPVVEDVRPRKRGRQAASVEGILIGGQDAEAIWQAYVEGAADHTNGIVLKRAAWVVFAKWVQGTSTPLGDGSVDAYMNYLQECGKVYTTAKGYAYAVKAILSHALTHAPNAVLPHIDPRKCLPYLGPCEEPAKKKASRGRRPRRYNKAWISEFFGITREMTDDELRKRMKAKIFDDHPDRGGSGRLVGPISELLKNVSPQIIFGELIDAMPIFRWYLWEPDEDEHFRRLSKAIFDSAGGWAALEH